MSNEFGRNKEKAEALASEIKSILKQAIEKGEITIKDMEDINAIKREIRSFGYHTKWAICGYNTKQVEITVRLSTPNTILRENCALTPEEETRWGQIAAMLEKEMSDI